MWVQKGVQSTIEPKSIDFSETQVFIAKNVNYTEVTEDHDAYYSFDLYCYNKNEYIDILKEDNDTLKNQLLDTQMALCEIYELLVEGE